MGEEPTGLGDGRKPVLQFEDLWDWAYCPLRVWWRKAEERGATSGARELRLSEDLIRDSVQQAIRVYYNLAGEKEDSVSVAEAFGAVWRTWLTEWGAGPRLAEELLRYQRERREILVRFKAGGDIRRPDGSLYRRPMWTRAWRKLAKSRGLLDLADKIDRAGEEAGIPRLEPSVSGGFAPPVGLADSFALSMDIVEKLDDLPRPDQVMGVGVPLTVELLSVRLVCEAPLVVDLGEKPARGRPPAGADGPRRARRLGYEIHLYGAEVPSPASIARDLRVLALSQARPAQLKLDADEAQLDWVTVRHMRTGRTQNIRPEAGEGGDILESIARSVLAGVRGGAYIPRMVCGWNACGDCGYRPLCFSETGVMESLNPPMLGQIEANQRRKQELQQIMGESGGKGALLPTMRGVMEWMAESPDLTPEGVLWLLEAAETETS